MTRFTGVLGSGPLARFYLILTFPPSLWSLFYSMSIPSSAVFPQVWDPVPGSKIWWVLFKSSLQTGLSPSFPTLTTGPLYLPSFYWRAKPLLFQLLSLHWSATLWTECLFAVLEFCCQVSQVGLSMLSAFSYTNTNHFLFLWL